MMWPISLIAFIGLQNFVTQISSQEYCINPEGLRGVCSNIRKCDPLLVILRSQTQESVVFLRSSFCGYEDKDPKVCCPIQEVNNNSPRIPQPLPPPVRFTQRPDTLQNDEADVFLRPPYCGFSNSTHKRVVGGENANLGAWPWIAVLGYRRKDGDPNPKWLCGGSLISKRHVLTAAHCIFGRSDLYLVRLGDLVLDDKVYDQADPVTIPIERSVYHPAYSSRTFSNDVGVIKLAWDVEFTDFIRPICLPVTEEIKALNLVGRRPFIAGWGSVTFKGPSSARLQEVQIPIVTQSSCKTAFAPFGRTVIDDRVICAGYAKGGKDACQGDSGGPLMLPIKTTYYAIGVISYGYKCAEPGFPGVYSRVEKFLDFIADQMS